eukprot:m.89327 g.89327  ORF g.89327 m.89327 type:complete len:916 (+) comp13212_c0_seq1:183-2930(+)
MKGFLVYLTILLTAFPSAFGFGEKCDGDENRNILCDVFGVCKGGYCCGVHGLDENCSRCAPTTGLCSLCKPPSRLLEGSCRPQSKDGDRCQADADCSEGGVCKTDHCCQSKWQCASCNATGCASCYSDAALFTGSTTCVKVAETGEYCIGLRCREGDCKTNCCDKKRIGCSQCDTSGNCTRCINTRYYTFLSNTGECAQKYGRPCESSNCGSDFYSCDEENTCKCAPNRVYLPNPVFKASGNCPLKNGFNCSSGNDCSDQNCVNGTCCPPNCLRCEYDRCVQCPDTHKRYNNETGTCEIQQEDECLTQQDCPDISFSCWQGADEYKKCRRMPRNSLSLCKTWTLGTDFVKSYFNCEECHTGFKRDALRNCFCNTNTTTVNCGPASKYSVVNWPQFNSNQPQSIILRGLKLDQPNSNLLDNVTRLQQLNIGDCDISGNTLPPGFLNKPTNISYLWLDSNKFTNIPGNMLYRLPNLTHVWLHDNSFTTLPENLFKSQDILVFLDLSFNRLQILPRNIFQYLTSLQTLSLKYNMLESLYLQLFNNLHSLEQLYVQWNNIAYLEKPFFSSNLSTLTMTNNLLTCELIETAERYILVDYASCYCNREHGDFSQNYVLENTTTFSYCISNATPPPPPPSPQSRAIFTTSHVISSASTGMSTEATETTLTTATTITITDTTETETSTKSTASGSISGSSIATTDGSQSSTEPQQTSAFYTSAAQSQDSSESSSDSLVIILVVLLVCTMLLAGGLAWKLYRTRRGLSTPKDDTPRSMYVNPAYPDRPVANGHSTLTAADDYEGAMYHEEPESSTDFDRDDFYAPVADGPDYSQLSRPGVAPVTMGQEYSTPKKKQRNTNTVVDGHHPYTNVLYQNGPTNRVQQAAPRPIRITHSRQYQNDDVPDGGQLPPKPTRFAANSRGRR